MILELTRAEAAEVRAAILDTRLPWSPVLDRVTKDIQNKIDNKE